jgi:large subunit ribosomal protein L5
MNLQQKFNDQIIPELQKELGVKNALAVPRLKKIVVSAGVGEAVQDKNLIEKAGADLSLITGQKPLVTKARKSVASFKVRTGMPLGLKVTLRKKRMFNFLEKLLWIVFPRLRDFRGVSGSHFDGRGNYTIGLKEQIVFPEIDYARIDKVRGLEITIVTSADNDVQAKLLLEKLGMPFEKN